MIAEASLDTLSLNFPNPCVWIWQNITDVTLTNCNISFLPKELGLLLYLRRINLSQNILGTISTSQWTWLDQATIKKNLTHLDISYNSVSRYTYNSSIKINENN